MQIIGKTFTFENDWQINRQWRHAYLQHGSTSGFDQLLDQRGRRRSASVWQVWNSQQGKYIQSAHDT